MLFRSSDKLINASLDGTCENKHMTVANAKLAVAASDLGRDSEEVEGCIQITVPYVQDDAFILPPPPHQMCVMMVLKP